MLIRENMSRNTKTFLIVGAILVLFVAVAAVALWLLSPFFNIANVVVGGK